MISNLNLSKKTKSSFIPDNLKTPELLELEAQIKHYNDNYTELKETIENQKQDQRLERLKEIYPSHPFLSIVSSDIQEDKPKVIHSRKMLSMEKITADPEKLSKWAQKFSHNEEIIIQPKLDWHSLSIHFKDFELTLAATRWDGKLWNDVTSNAKNLKWVLSNIILSESIINKLTNLFPSEDEFNHIEIRGETIIKNSDFKEISSLYVNARNGVSLANIKNPEEIKQRKMSFIAYNIFIGKDKESEIDETIKFEILKELWFETPIFEKHTALQLQDPEYSKNVVSSLEKFRDETGWLDYSIDWLVLKANSALTKKELWENDHDPNWAVAWKYLAEEKDTIIENIEWTVSRNGSIIPVWLLKPVELSQTTVARVTLNNLAYVEWMKISKWDTVSIRKSGEIIPFLVKNVTKSTVNNWSGDVIDNSSETINTSLTSSIDNLIPSNCPSCWSQTSKDWVHLKCNNVECSGRQVKTILHFCSSLGIDAIGEWVIQGLYDNKLIKYPSDIFTLKAEDIAVLDWFGASSAKKIVNSIEKIKNSATPEKLIKAIGIQGLGERVASRLLKKYLSIENLLNSGKYDDIVWIEWFWENNTKAFLEWLEKEKDIIKSLAEVMNIYSVEKEANISKTLEGKSFCITWTLSTGRSEMEKFIESHSWAVKSDVNGNLSFLVLGENGWSKKDKAEKIIASWKPLRIITEDELRAMAQWNN